MVKNCWTRRLIVAGITAATLPALVVFGGAAPARAAAPEFLQVPSASMGQVPGGRPHFVLSGSVRAGSLKIRRPTYVRLGALVIRFPGQGQHHADPGRG